MLGDRHSGGVLAPLYVFALRLLRRWLIGEHDVESVRLQLLRLPETSKFQERIV